MAKGDESVSATLNSVIGTYSLLGLFKEEPKAFLEGVDRKNKADIPDEIKALAERRWQAKREKNFALADSLRADLENLGYVVKDTREGYEISKA